METITLRPKPPYDIRTHFKHYGSMEPQPYVYKDGVYRRTFRLGNGKLVPVEVELNEDIERPNLKIRIYSKLTKSEEKEVTEEIKQALCTEHDLWPLYRFMNSDPVLKRVKNNN